jgi:hypothetical protein
MPHGDVIDIASAPVDSAQAGRAARTGVVESAWVARRDSRAMEAYESRKRLASFFGERL